MRQVYLAALVLIISCNVIQYSNVQQRAANSKLDSEIGKVICEFYDAFGHPDAAKTEPIFADDGFSNSREPNYKKGRSQVRRRSRS